MEYDRSLFDPPAAPAAPSGPASGPVYVYSEPIVLAVNVALATGRPLLVAGPPGSGKSTLARNVAAEKKWRYLQRVITSRTQADDLLAGFDALRRLNDAQLQGRELLPDAGYVEPGVLWWAYDRASARVRGASQPERAVQGFREARDPSEGQGRDVVVLLDEIDKADPDVPNDLLEPLDLRSFTPPHAAAPVRAAGEVLVIITTNGERELPPAFMRRCVFLALEAMGPDELVRVAETHYGAEPKPELYATLAGWMTELRQRARAEGLREPGTAEYLDAVKACVRLGVGPADQAWKDVARAAMWKHEGAPPGSEPE
jgi:MoxR-like ATPase